MTLSFTTTCRFIPALRRKTMARPKLPTAQRKVLTMMVRMRQDLDEGFAAGGLLRGRTKSGRVRQYTAEQITQQREEELDQIRSEEVANGQTKTVSKECARHNHC